MSLISSFLGYQAADKQADASKAAGDLSYKASQEATAEQRRQFDIMRGYLDPVYNDSRAASSVYMQALGLGAPPAPQGVTTQPYGQPTQVQQPSAPSMTQRQPAPGTLGAGIKRWGDTFRQSASGDPIGAGAALPMTGSTAQPSAAPTGAVPSSASPMDIGAMVRGQPGYQEQLEDGMTAIDRAAPLRGGMYSGRRMKALNDYGQRSFGSYYDAWMNRVGGVAGQAPVVGGQIGSAGMNMAGNIGNNLMTGANAQGAGKLGAANAWSGYMGDMAGKLSGFNALKFMGMGA